MRNRIALTLITIPLIAILSVGANDSDSNDRNMISELSIDKLPTRKGDAPSTTNTNPHTQLDQQPEDLTYINDLMDWAFELSHITRKPSAISVPGAVAMFLDRSQACKSCNAFMIGTEFAHFHPKPDYSMHLGLPKEDAQTIIDKGWGEWHPMIDRGFLPPHIIMLYAPRNEEEFEVAKFVLGRSYDYANGKFE